MVFNMMKLYMDHMKKGKNQHHYIIMFVIMILSGILSTMNVWVDKYEDIRFSINDLYMVLLMTGWMFFFMGVIYQEFGVFVTGAMLVVANMYFIRNQIFVTESQYRLGMIPHHSMAVHMSKRLLERGYKDNQLDPFLKNLIDVQESEIAFLKNN
jgi:hypothetical protein